MSVGGVIPGPRGAGPERRFEREKRLGIVSLGDIAMADGPQSSGVALCGISEPGGDHSQESAVSAH